MKGLGGVLRAFVRKESNIYCFRRAALAPLPIHPAPSLLSPERTITNSPIRHTESAATRRWEGERNRQRSRPIHLYSALLDGTVPVLWREAKTAKGKDQVKQWAYIIAHRKVAAADGLYARPDVGVFESRVFAQESTSCI